MRFLKDYFQFVTICDCVAHESLTMMVDCLIAMDWLIGWVYQYCSAAMLTMANAMEWHDMDRRLEGKAMVKRCAIDVFHISHCGTEPTLVPVHQQSRGVGVDLLLLFVWS